MHTMLHTKLNIATGLDCCLSFAFSSSSIRFESSARPQLSINLLEILVGTGILHLWAWVSGGVYRSWCLDALEGSFVLNLIILVGATCYVKEGNQLAVGYTSVSIAFVTFIGMLAFHIFQQLRHTKLWKKVPKLNLKFNRQNVNNSSMVGDAHFNQPHEPLLEDHPQPNYGAV